MPVEGTTAWLAAGFDRRDRSVFVLLKGAGRFQAGLFDAFWFERRHLLLYMIFLASDHDHFLKLCVFDYLARTLLLFLLVILQQALNDHLVP